FGAADRSRATGKCRLSSGPEAGVGLEAIASGELPGSRPLYPAPLPQRLENMKKVQSQSCNPPDGESRRSFIRKTAGVAATVATANLLKTPVYGQSQAPSSGRVIGANDRIVVGYIGVGSQGTAHLKFQKTHAQENNIAQAAVCDVYQKRLQSAKAFLGLPDTAAYGDHRKLL